KRKCDFAKCFTFIEPAFQPGLQIRKASWLLLAGESDTETRYYPVVLGLGLAILDRAAIFSCGIPIFLENTRTSLGVRALPREARHCFLPVDVLRMECCSGHDYGEECQPKPARNHRAPRTHTQPKPV